MGLYIHHVISMPFINSSMMSDSTGKAGVTSASAETISSVDQRELAIEGIVIARCLSLVPPFVANSNVTEREGGDCVRRELEQIGGEIAGGAELARPPDADEESEGAVVNVVGDGLGDEGA